MKKKKNLILLNPVCEIDNIFIKVFVWLGTRWLADIQERCLWKTLSSSAGVSERILLDLYYVNHNYKWIYLQTQRTLTWRRLMGWACTGRSPWTCRSLREKRETYFLVCINNNKSEGEKADATLISCKRIHVSSSVLHLLWCVTRNRHRKVWYPKQWCLSNIWRG